MFDCPAIIVGAMTDDLLPALQWRLPGGVRIAFSTAASGDQRDPERRSAWLASLGVAKALVVPAQIHGSLVVRCPAPADQLMIADGLASSDPSTALGVFGADCPGLCLIAADALAHCGWRGTAAGIVGRLVQELAQISSQPVAQWQAFIGPGISGERYEVDAAVLDARRWPAQSLSPSRPGHARLDLKVAIATDLRAHGVVLLEAPRICTAGDPRLWSYRRRGPGLVQLLSAWRDEPLAQQA
jgi:hypothetical protein